MAKEMLINLSEGEECRIALVENGRLEELYMERTSATSHVGNIYKGRVTNVEPSIQAAFVDFGLGRNGFLHISDLMPTYFGWRGEDVQETVGRKLARRDRPPIQKCLRRGDEIIVQIIKEGIGTKGPTLSTYISIPGRFLVMMPGMTSKGVSRKIEDEVERRRLRQILDSLQPTDECGFILRTAGVGKTKAEIERDLKYLVRLWETIKKKRDAHPAPVELYTEGDLVTRTVRDVFSSDIDRLVVDNKEVARKVREFFKIALPRTRNKVELYEEPTPLFHKYGIEKEIEQMYSRHVPLPSGGSLVIDSTEAIVAIDVNSGRFRDHSDAEMTAFKTDMEAADEIPRQLRLRDLGGVIICDFIDLRYERHRRELEKRLHENLSQDRAKTKMLRMSQFGIIEMTRQRMRPSLKRSIYCDCPGCKGSGLVKTPESMGLDVMRRLAIAINDLKVHRIELAVCPSVEQVLANRKRAQLAALEDRYHKRITVRADVGLAMDEIRLDLYDSREGLVFLDALGQTPPTGAPTSGRGQRHDRRHRRDGHRGQQVQELESATMELEEMVEEPQTDVDDARREELASESAAGNVPPVGEVSAEDQGPGYPPSASEPQQGGQGRRRRRRRRGRGRRGGGEGAPLTGDASAAGPFSAQGPDDEVEAPTEESWPGSEDMGPAPTEEAPVLPTEDEQPLLEPVDLQPQSSASQGDTEGGGRRRRRRGGRRRRGRGGSGGQGGGPQPAGQHPQPQANPSASTPRPPAPIQPPLVRTGSTDRHLIHNDEPVEPQPLSRPRTYRDLDNIPDDMA